MPFSLVQVSGDTAAISGVEAEPRQPLRGGGLVVVGGLDGEVIALDAAAGTEKWRARVGAEVIAAPVIGDGLYERNGFALAGEAEQDDQWSGGVREQIFERAMPQAARR